MNQASAMSNSLVVGKVNVPPYSGATTTSPVLGSVTYFLSAAAAGASSTCQRPTGRLRSGRIQSGSPRSLFLPYHSWFISLEKSQLRALIPLSAPRNARDGRKRAHSRRTRATPCSGRSRSVSRLVSYRVPPLARAAPKGSHARRRAWWRCCTSPICFLLPAKPVVVDWWSRPMSADVGRWRHGLRGGCVPCASLVPRCSTGAARIGGPGHRVPGDA